MRSTFFVFVSTSLQVNEIAQYLLSDVRAFLRMELQRVEIIFLQSIGIAGKNRFIAQQNYFADIINF